jgi:preprotein translocase, YajC subunit
VDPCLSAPAGDNGRLVGDEVPCRGRGRPRIPPDTKVFSRMESFVFLPLLVVLGAFMFFASRKQKKLMQATIDLHNSLRVGDRIHTTSGLQGTIRGISDDYIELEIAPGVVTTWMKLAVRDKIEPETTEADDTPADDTADTPADGDR